MKKLIPAIVMLLVSAVVLSTASYAWFSVGTSVTATGLSVKADAPASISIKGELKNGNWTEYSHTVAFDQTTVTVSPVSSWDGVDFWYPSDCYDNEGSVAYGATFTKTNDANQAYVIKYQLMLQNNGALESDPVDIALDSLVGDGTRIDGAIRVAFIVDGEVFIYMLDGNQESWVRVPVLGDDDLPTYTDSEDGKADGPIKTNTGAFAEYAQGEESNYATVDVTPIITDLEPQEEVAVTVLIWIEGQDARCMSANAGLTTGIALTFKILPATTTTEAPTEAPSETPEGN